MSAPSPALPVLPTVRLKRGSAKPLHAGHPWVFAGALARLEGPEAKAGDEVRVVDDGGTCLGRGFFSPDSAIAVRLISRADTAITDAVLASRIDDAIRLRRDVLHLGAGTAPASTAAPQLPPKELELLASLEQQLAKIQTFAAQYGMDSSEETAELRGRRAELLKRAGASPEAAASLPALPTTAYRLINSEGDGLGGLIVDVYGDYVAVQIGSAGFERRLETVLDLLEARLHPKAIFDRSDARARQIEKLPPPRSGALRGEAPDGPRTVTECGLKFSCDLRPGFGQKTGLYLDQRENRRLIGTLAQGRDVLDAFCYSGAFTLHASRGGAKSLTLVDASAEALEMARQNLELNRIDDADLIEADWPEAFKHLREQGRQFGLIVLDPPKFAPAREHLARALSGYRDLNAQAARLLAPNGLLLTCSCSGSVSELDFERTVAAGLHSAGRRATLLECRSAGPDHPIPPGFDQGKYLKALLLHVV